MNAKAKLTVLLDALFPRPRALALMLWLVIGALVRLQLESLHSPVMGEHNWRQADTYSIAYNFVHDSADFFHPRIDWSREHSGVMGMETPIYPWITHVAMRIFGDHPGTARAMSWLLALLACIIGLRGIFTERERAERLFFVLAGLLSPLVIIEWRNIQPDGVMTSFALMAAGQLALYARDEKPSAYVSGLFFYTLAVLTKAPAILLGPAMVLFAIGPGGKRWSWKSAILRAIPFVLPLILWFAWDRWARHLTKTYHGGVTYFALDFNLDAIKGVLGDENQQKHFFRWVFTANSLGWMTLPWFFAGLLVGGKREHWPRSIPMLTWLAAGLFFCACFADRLMSHWYYAMIVAPAAMYFCALGAGSLFSFARGRMDAHRGARLAFVITFLSLLAFKVVTPEAQLGEHAPGASGAFGIEHWASWMSERGVIVLLGISMLAMLAVSTRWVWRTPTCLASVLVAGALWYALPSAARDASETFDFRTNWRNRDQQEELDAEARALMDRWTTRADKILSDADGNPFFLFIPLRKGFAESADTINSRRLSYYRRYGVKVALHFKDHGMPRELRELEPLEETEHFALYCVTEPCARRAGAATHAAP